MFLRSKTSSFKIKITFNHLFWVFLKSQKFIKKFYYCFPSQKQLQNFQKHIQIYILQPFQHDKSGDNTISFSSTVHSLHQKVTKKNPRKYCHEIFDKTHKTYWIPDKKNIFINFWLIPISGRQSPIYSQHFHWI